jgi:hypothetical protein
VFSSFSFFGILKASSLLIIRFGCSEAVFFSSFAMSSALAMISSAAALVFSFRYHEKTSSLLMNVIPAFSSSFIRKQGLY